jgi:hypothetical protein
MSQTIGKTLVGSNKKYKNLKNCQVRGSDVAVDGAEDCILTGSDGKYKNLKNCQVTGSDVAVNSAEDCNFTGSDLRLDNIVNCKVTGSDIKLRAAGCCIVTGSDCKFSGDCYDITYNGEPWDRSSAKKQKQHNTITNTFSGNGMQMNCVSGGGVSVSTMKDRNGNLVVTTTRNGETTVETIPSSQLSGGYSISQGNVQLGQQRNTNTNEISIPSNVASLFQAITTRTQPSTVSVSLGRNENNDNDDIERRVSRILNRRLDPLNFDNSSRPRTSIQQRDGETNDTLGASISRSPVAPAAEENEPIAEGSQTACAVCMERQARVIAIPCSHLNLCIQCSREIVEREKEATSCPICKTKVEKFMRVFT